MTVPSQDNAYVSGHAYLFYGDDELTIPIEKGDALPPTLTVTLTPNWVIATNQLYPITATIAVTDNYDPQPEIKLESITVSEVSGAGDIVGAAIRMDDRQFQLMGAVAAGSSNSSENKLITRSVPSRTYMVTYSATDGSGNKTLTSAMANVQIGAIPSPTLGASIVQPSAPTAVIPVFSPPFHPPRPWWKFW
ncbi:MAG: hypothetical protein HOP24_01970 [Sideroxydans sp.]|nr:hypothetical protein [Sideroxydans sp.]